MPATLLLISHLFLCSQAPEAVDGGRTPEEEGKHVASGAFLHTTRAHLCDMHMCMRGGTQHCSDGAQGPLPTTLIPPPAASGPCAMPRLSEATPLLQLRPLSSPLPAPPAFYSVPRRTCCRSRRRDCTGPRPVRLAQRTRRFCLRSRRSSGTSPRCGGGRCSLSSYASFRVPGMLVGALYVGKTLLACGHADFACRKRRCTPQDILRGAADEVLAVLKDDKKMDPERKREIEKLLGGISSEHFATLVVRFRLLSSPQQQLALHDLRLAQLPSSPTGSHAGAHFKSPACARHCRTSANTSRTSCPSPRARTPPRTPPSTTAASPSSSRTRRTTSTAAARWTRRVTQSLAHRQQRRAVHHSPHSHLPP